MQEQVWIFDTACVTALPRSERRAKERGQALREEIGKIKPQELDLEHFLVRRVGEYFVAILCDSSHTSKHLR